MSSASIISVRDLSKAYTLYEKPLDAVREVLFGGTRHDVFWALKNVSFEVKEGERVGVVGPNGAGKSTLLKIITGNLNPTAGAVDVHGKVSAMLSLTSFLNPDETGLENIRFNLIVNGVKRQDLPRLTEEIVEFTELGAFVHAPVRTYSSGMNARLAFTISTALTPDVLVVDEVLSAGDGYFATKATMRMIELCNQGRALLFVSHAVSAIQLLCNRAIWLDGGTIRADGPVDEIVAQYETEFRQHEDAQIRPGNQERRRRLANVIMPAELEHEGFIRLRLTEPKGRLVDTHYVRRIQVEFPDGTTLVPLELQDLGSEGTHGFLDLHHSEWGRLHNRRGLDSRALGPSSRPLRGGHVLVRPATALPEGPLSVSVTIEATTIEKAAPLELEAADPQTGTWARLEAAQQRALEDNWTSTRYEGVVTYAPTRSTELLERLLEGTRPDVEILDVAMIVEGRRIELVAERQPFSIAVRVVANRVVPLADVGIKFDRDDGLYVFWQSSGQTGHDLRDLAGEKTVVFDFDPNILGSGDYIVTVEIGNGLDIDRNWPHSEVFDRQVNALRFTVTREWKLVMFGPLNKQFPVRVLDEWPLEAAAEATDQRALGAAGS